MNKLKIKLNQKNIIGDTVIVGITGGQNSLLPWCIIDEKSNILDKGNFNSANGKDYFFKISKFRKNIDWEESREKKDLLNGYTTAVIGDISQIILDYMDVGIIPIIILEKSTISKQFKGFGNTFYKNFALSLIKKLNYLFDKSKKEGPGSILDAYQLTPQYSEKSHGDIMNIINGNGQLGIIFIN